MSLAKLQNPAAAAANWSSRTAASDGRYKQGIQDTQVNPMQLAADKADDWFRGVQDAHANNRFAGALAGRNVMDWKGPAMDKGAKNYVTGAQAGKAKYAAFAADFFPVLAGIVTQIKSMPSGRGGNNKARMNAYFEASSNYTYRRGGRAA